MSRMLLFLWCLITCYGGVSARNITNQLGYQGNYNNIKYFLEKTGLYDVVIKAPNVTLFLPTDEALADYPPGYVSALVHDLPKLKKILEYHIVLGENVRGYSTKNNNRILTSMTNQPIRLNYYRLDIKSDKGTAQGVKIVQPNMPVDNGFINGMSGFMVPPEGDMMHILSSRPDMKIFSSFVRSAGVEDVYKLQNSTLFAPTDAAFSKLNPEVLTYLNGTSKGQKKNLKDLVLYSIAKNRLLYSIALMHVLPIQTADPYRDSVTVIHDFHSDDIYINNALVNETDISATNGVIHTIEDVLIPPRTVVAIERAGVNLG